MKSVAVSLLLALILCGTVRAAEPRPFSHPDRIRYDSHCLTIEGKDTFIFSGGFHYFRCPKELWRERFQKIKEAGCNAVETYVAWNWHEREAPASVDDYSKVDLRELEEWLNMAEEFGFYIIIRPGPYICAEWDNGGFPHWIITKKPAQPRRTQAWLRTDDPVFLAWSQHWMHAVCPVIAPHQITRKPAGAPGVILFQLENEYDYGKIPAEIMVNYLTALAHDATADDIDVPLFTCWTNPVRGVQSGPLRAVFDSCNLYPLWKVSETAKNIDRLRAQQPDAPLMTAELQGGWFAKVGGVLSEKQEGVTATQLQNLTLWTLQHGETITNYYMLFGGTNFDDTAARDIITSYDYNAPIREHGGVGDRYQRVRAIGHMLQDHGAKLTRAEPVELEVVKVSDKDVEVAERRAQDGSRYLFVRTGQHVAARAGTASVREKGGISAELSFDYKLEPFGSLVLYLPPGVTDAKAGEWLPKPAPDIARPSDLPQPIALTKAMISQDPTPTKWAHLQPGELIENRGMTGSHFLYYQLEAKPGAAVSVDLRKGDALVASAGGRLLKLTPQAKGVAFTMPQSADTAVLLYENAGHTNFGLGQEEPNGIRAVHGAKENDALTFAPGSRFDGTERGAGEALSRAETELDPAEWSETQIKSGAAPAPDALLTWYRMEFAMPSKKAGVWVPWHLHLEAEGNGFLYLNGHCLGRYWQAGPQHDYYLPECWFEFGPEKKNTIAIDLRPVDKGVSVSAAEVVPDNAFAESR